MTHPKLFGTDGIRTHVTSSILSPENVTRLGHILAKRAHQNFFGVPKTPATSVVIGRDTRDSGAYLEHALLAGFAASGVDACVLGIVPTAVVAFYTRALNAQLGIMISASHNPYCDNGLKIFDSNGFKIDETQEQQIEQDFFHFYAGDYPVSMQPGVITYGPHAQHDYLSTLKDAFTPDLAGLTVVIDNANGAASAIARSFFQQLGATIFTLNEHAPGQKINFNCGSEAPDALKQEVVRRGAHCGIAFDGDADRVIFVDEHGNLMDGDAILALMAIDQKARGHLLRDTLVATVMSSVALDRALVPHNIEVVRTAVGDKYVAQAMRDDGYSFGGENSGHMILFPYATTGDAISSACYFLSILKQSKKSASDLVSFFTPTPRVLKNILVAQKLPLENLPKTEQAIAEINLRLSSSGRVFLRYSGTENKARLLVEAQTKTDCERIAEEIGAAFLVELNEKLAQTFCAPKA